VVSSPRPSRSRRSASTTFALTASESRMRHVSSTGQLCPLRPSARRRRGPGERPRPTSTPRAASLIAADRAHVSPPAPRRPAVPTRSAQERFLDRTSDDRRRPGGPQRGEDAHSGHAGWIDTSTVASGPEESVAEDSSIVRRVGRPPGWGRHLGAHGTDRREKLQARRRTRPPTW
jgi:hypothetical protein